MVISACLRYNVSVCLTFAVSVQDIQCCNEELVGVLLLIAGQVTGVGPHEVEEAEWDVR